jgi:alkylation response protein AidB-like acyl-CoA dehydrogenase
MVRQLADRVIGPRAAAIDESAEFPWDIVDIFRAQDLFGMTIPEEYGGTGLPLLVAGLVYYEVARACLTSSATLADQKLGSDPIVYWGDEKLKRRYLPAIARGEQLIAFALTESSAGSDIAAIRTRARREGNTYAISGEKTFITNGSVADLFTVFAVTDPEADASRRLTCFVVPRLTPGVSIGRIEKKMGLRGSPTTEVRFADCVVPTTNLIGNEGEGFEIALTTMNPARVVVAFQAVGLAEAAMEYALLYDLKRIQFGRPVFDFQGVKFMLADMSMRLDAARHLTYAAAEACELRLPTCTRLAAEAKALASDVAMAVTTDAVQLLGGYGYIQDYPVERMMRDAKILQIFDGTNQIQRLVIARELAQQIRGRKDVG